MPELLTEASTMICPHGALVMSVPCNPRVTAGTVVLSICDTFVVADCPFSDGTGPSPCMTVQWVVGALRVATDGVPLLNDASVGLCLSATEFPQGMVLVVSAQPRALGV